MSCMLQCSMLALRCVKPGCCVPQTQLPCLTSVRRRMCLLIPAINIVNGPRGLGYPISGRVGATRVNAQAGGSEALDTFLTATQVVGIAAAAAIHMISIMSQQAGTGAATQVVATSVATSTVSGAATGLAGWVTPLLLVAITAGAWLNHRLRTRTILYSGVSTAAHAAAKLVQMDVTLQQQATDMAKVLQQSNKLQTRVRLSNRDYKLPIKQLQQRTAEQADVLSKLTEAQERLDADLRDTQELLNALQGGHDGLSAKQVKVMTDTFQRLQGEQAQLRNDILHIKNTSSVASPSTQKPRQSEHAEAAAHSGSPDKPLASSPPSSQDLPRQASQTTTPPPAGPSAITPSPDAAAPSLVAAAVAAGTAAHGTHRFKDPIAGSATDECPCTSGRVAADRSVVVGPLFAVFNNPGLSCSPGAPPAADAISPISAGRAWSAGLVANSMAGTQALVGEDSSSIRVNNSAASRQLANASTSTGQTRMAAQAAVNSAGKSGEVSAAYRCRNVLRRVAADRQTEDDADELYMPMDMLGAQYEVLLGRFHAAEEAMTQSMTMVPVTSAAAAKAKPAAAAAKASARRVRVQGPGPAGGALQGAPGLAGLVEQRGGHGRGVVLMGKPKGSKPSNRLEWVVVDKLNGAGDGNLDRSVATAKTDNGVTTTSANGCGSSANSAAVVGGSATPSVHVFGEANRAAHGAAAAASHGNAAAAPLPAIPVEQPAPVTGDAWSTVASGPGAVRYNEDGTITFTF